MELSLMKQAASGLAWPHTIQIIRVDSDIMYPTFKTGDFLAVDTEQRAVREGVYVLECGGSFVVRRFNIPLAGRVLVVCDNQDYPPETVSVETLEKQILGRVVFAEARIF